MWAASGSGLAANGHAIMSICVPWRRGILWIAQQLLPCQETFWSMKYVGCTHKDRRLIYGLIQINLVRFKVLTPITMKGSIFWHVTPCRLVDVYGFSEGHNAYIFSVEKYVHQADKQKQAASRALCLLCLLGLFLDPEDGRNTSLQITEPHIPRDSTLK
jgi:hypothetical protein